MKKCINEEIRVPHDSTTRDSYCSHFRVFPSNVHICMGVHRDVYDHTV